MSWLAVAFSSFTLYRGAPIAWEFGGMGRSRRLRRAISFSYEAPTLHWNPSTRAGPASAHLN